MIIIHYAFCCADIMQGENCEICALDCPCVVNCGNGLCESGESKKTCPQDCPKGRGICGNGICEADSDGMDINR